MISIILELISNIVSAICTYIYMYNVSENVLWTHCSHVWNISTYSQLGLSRRRRKFAGLRRVVHFSVHVQTLGGNLARHWGLEGLSNILATAHYVNERVETKQSPRTPCTVLDAYTSMRTCYRNCWRPVLYALFAITVFKRHQLHSLYIR